MKRKFPIGAEVSTTGVHFRVWAPRSRSVAVEFFSPDGEHLTSTTPLQSEDNGYFSGEVSTAHTGDLYKFRLDQGPFPDPASRFQPKGPHGPSQIVDPQTFTWTDQTWRGRPVAELVISEIHVGTFTREGTWRSAMEQLPELARAGITALEIMPIADFPGRFGWGYDGVDIFAPCHLYGSPDDVRAFVNRAHELGLIVILDVVYNHLGPDGNYVGQFSPDYFSAKHGCEWGQAINFDDDHAGPVREFFITNACVWIDEFHFDGLRFDATQQIFDDSNNHILFEIARSVREIAGARQLYLVAENENQNGRLVRPTESGGYGLDAIWNDDFHHTAMVAATGHTEAYYNDYRGKAQEFVSALKHGFLYQGQWYRWQRQRRGRPAFDLLPKNFVVFLQNHDQIANTLRGLRLHQVASPGHFRALTALMLLAPCTPMLFQGQEFAASQPFHFFADHGGELQKLVSEGRGKFMQQFRTIATAESQAILPAPHDEATFRRCQLDFSERARNADTYRLHIDLLKLRREDPVIRARAGFDGAVLSEDAFVLRYFSATNDDRILLVNLGTDLALTVSPEPLLAPPEGRGWHVLWSSESPAYGGGGTPDIETTAGWLIPGRAAVLLQPHENARLPDAKLSEKD